MSSAANSQQLIAREYLPLRAKILEIGAALDRLERVGGDVSQHDGWRQLQQALEILQRCPADRAEQLLMHFSRPYQDRWRAEWGL